MQELNTWIDEIPPLVQPSRFGNKAFRIWFDRLCNVSPLYHACLFRIPPPSSKRSSARKTSRNAKSSAAISRIPSAIPSVSTTAPATKPPSSSSSAVSTRRSFSSAPNSPPPSSSFSPRISKCVVTSKPSIGWSPRDPTACGVWTTTSCFPSCSAPPS